MTSSRRWRNRQHNLRNKKHNSRRNSLRIHGLAESTNENTDELIVKLAKEKLKINMAVGDIDRSHRLYPRNLEASEGPKPLIVKFARYKVRDEFYRARTKLRGSKIYVNEHLTKNRQILFNKARKCAKVKKIWTNDCKITVLTKDDEKVRISSERDIEQLL